MKPIRIALVHRGHWYRGQARVDGQFAYNVPEFTWFHHVVQKQFQCELSTLDCDMIWWDDGKYQNEGALFRPGKDKRTKPVIQYALYPTLTDSHFNSRYNRAKINANLLLIDHDDVSRYGGIKCPARRLAYSVNDTYYYDQARVRDIDVGFYCVWAYSKERNPMHHWLEDWCKRKGYTFDSTYGKSVEHYPNLLARTKVVVHLNRTMITRPPRIFDCAASGTALLSNPMPKVTGESWIPGTHYRVFHKPQGTTSWTRNEPHPPFKDADCQEIIEGLEVLIDTGRWEVLAANAKAYVMAHHTWRTRATQLRAILDEVFPEGRVR